MSKKSEEEIQEEEIKIAVSNLGELNELFRLGGTETLEEHLLKFTQTLVEKYGELEHTQEGQDDE